MFLTVAMLIASSALLIAPSSNGAATRHQLPEGYKWGRCFLEVDGKSYLLGRCAYLIEEDGSFEIVDPHQFWDKTGYFATVDFFEGTAEGRWNEENGAGHAQTPLGTLKRQGACWVNKRARICLWRK